MVLLEQCAFAHVPRTGGTFLRTMLEPKMVGYYDHGVHSSLTLDLRMRGVPVFGFVRDPVTWYESWYALCVNGSDVFPAATQDPTILAIGTDKTIDEVVHALCNPTQKLKEEAMKMAIWAYGGRLSYVMLDLLQRWLHSDVSFYENICNAYIHECTHVGKFEAMPETLVQMLKSVGACTDSDEQRILTNSPINHATRKPENAVSAETAAFIRKMDARLCTAYGYAK